MVLNLSIAPSQIYEFYDDKFIQTNGNKFILGENQYTAVGMCNYPFSFGNFDYITRTTRRAKTAGITLIRACPTFYDNFSLWKDEQFWLKIDWLLKTCRDEKMRMMLDLSGFRNSILNGLNEDPWAPESYSYWDSLVDFATARANSFTGVLYRDDPTLFLWLISGEPVPYGFTGDIHNESRDVNVIENLFFHVADRLRVKAPNQLISAGGLLHMNVPLDDSGKEYWKTIWAYPSIDCGAIHIYLDDYTTLPAGSWSHLQEYKEFCDQIGKPFVLEEWGINFYEQGITIAENYYRWGFDKAYNLDIPVSVNWDWAPSGGFSVFPGHGDSLLEIISENTVRWGYEGPIYTYLDPPISGDTLWSFEDGTDGFFSTNYGGNNGPLSQSDERATDGSYSLLMPVNFSHTNWDFAGATVWMSKRYDWTQENKIACDVWIPAGIKGLSIKFILSNDEGAWTNFAQKGGVFNNWLEGGKWTTVYADLSSFYPMDWDPFPQRLDNVSALSIELHHGHGTPTFMGDVFIDNIRLGDFQIASTTAWMLH